VIEPTWGEACLEINHEIARECLGAKAKRVKTGKSERDCTNLGEHVLTADDDGVTERHTDAKNAELVSDLEREFARRCQRNGIDAIWISSKTLQNRQCKRCSLSTASFGAANKTIMCAR
jgi:hypothetical protein